MKKTGYVRMLIKILVGAVLLLLLLFYGLLLYPMWGGLRSHQHGKTPPITPAWALECWLWEDDANTAEAALELLDGYRQHDLPVRTILLDSPWSTRYNDFVVDRQRYPQPEQFFQHLENQGYRVVLWMTCMVNRKNKDTAISDADDWFELARSKNYLALNGSEVDWWKGRGGFIDYSNPEALQWWHGLQQSVLKWGVDGWKLDGTATYFHTDLGPIPLPYGRTHAGWLTLREYMTHYYRDEYQHGLRQNPEFITLARSLDSPLPHAHIRGFAPLDAAPVTWVGDNQHTWDDASRGLERALSCILRSAEIGYSVIGSDVAGYHGSMPIPGRLYIRWAQFSSFCGLFLNGGHGERRLWKRSAEELGIIRKFSWLHTELVPYMYSHVISQHQGGKALMRPLNSGKYHYLFGDDLLIAPIYQDSLRLTVSLPEGRWRYFFSDAAVIQGPTTITREFPLDEYPVFIREGAIIPMAIERAYTGIGRPDWKNFLTLNIYPAGKRTFTLTHRDGSGQLTITVSGADTLVISLAGALKPHILRLFSEKPPRKIILDDRELRPATDWFFIPEEQRIIIKTTTCERGEYRIYR